MLPTTAHPWTAFRVLAVSTSGTVVLAMVGAAAVQFNSGAGLLGVVALGWAFLALAILFLIAATRRASRQGRASTLYSLASAPMIGLAFLGLQFAWASTGTATIVAPATEATLVVALLGSITTSVLSLVRSARELKR